MVHCLARQVLYCDPTFKNDSMSLTNYVHHNIYAYTTPLALRPLTFLAKLVRREHALLRRLCDHSGIMPFDVQVNSRGFLYGLRSWNYKQYTRSQN